MITSFIFNDYDLIEDNRTYCEITGLEPSGSSVGTGIVAGNKRINSVSRDNRKLSINGTILHDACNFAKNLYKTYPTGLKMPVRVITEEDENYFECLGVVEDVAINRYKHPMTYNLSIICDGPFLYKATQTYSSTDELTIDSNIPQNAIKIIYNITENTPEEVVFDTFGVTKVVFDNVSDYVGKTMTIDIEKKTCRVDGVNKFYLVKTWSDCTTKDFIIPDDAIVEFREKVLGVW